MFLNAHVNFRITTLDDDHNIREEFSVHDFPMRIYMRYDKWDALSWEEKQLYLDERLWERVHTNVESVTIEDKNDDIDETKDEEANSFIYYKDQYGTNFYRLNDGGIVGNIPLPRSVCETIVKIMKKQYPKKTFEIFTS